ncbi:WG repeat-containing protein [Sphingobacterium tabacisoli]|uniref:WG repeat-containing protein n=1 Tax=Sphingobacterium tabacisoli TaxID=2044855 RepID=A0ABW5L3H3_9SPHI|nr:WG repeat-containing protein [Sphingobacterium tabacisoli]
MFRFLVTLFIGILCSLQSFAQEEFRYYSYGSNEKMGLLNKDGVPLTERIYSYIGGYSEGTILVKLEEEYLFIDTLGKEVLPFRYDYAEKFKDGSAIVCIGDRFGVIDRQGNYLLPLEYTSLDRVSDKANVFVAAKNDKEGLIDFKGRRVLPFDYDNIFSFEQGNAVAKKNGLRGLINSDGHILLDFRYLELGNCLNGVSLTYSMENNAKYGLMDLKQKVLVEPLYRYLYAAEDGFVYGIERDGGEELVWDKKGKPIITGGYDNVERISEGLFLVEKGGKNGFVDRRGKLVIPLIYDAARSFSEGLAPVLKDGYWGFIDKKGNTVIDFKFVGVMEGFYNGYAGYGKRSYSSGAHYTSDLWGIINKKGELILENKYYRASIEPDGKFVVEFDGKTFLMDQSGKIICELLHEERPVMVMDLS